MTLGLTMEEIQQEIGRLVLENLALLKRIRELEPKPESEAS